MAWNDYLKMSGLTCRQTQFGGLLSDLWLDLQRPAVLWQVAVLALCLGLAWLVGARQCGARPASVQARRNSAGAG